ncbi:hypothetical protein [Weissella koreensis]|nr:hypothetical protein [Weissella koreensis]
MIDINALSDKFMTELIKNTTPIEQSNLSDKDKIMAIKTLINQLNELY